MQGQTVTTLIPVTLISGAFKSPNIEIQGGLDTICIPVLISQTLISFQPISPVFPFSVHHSLIQKHTRFQNLPFGLYFSLIQDCTNSSIFAVFHQ